VTAFINLSKLSLYIEVDQRYNIKIQATLATLKYRGQGVKESRDQGVNDSSEKPYKKNTEQLAGK